MPSIFILLDSAKLQADCATVFFIDEFVLFEYLGVHVFTDSVNAMLCWTSFGLIGDCLLQDIFYRLSCKSKGSN